MPIRYQVRSRLLMDMVRDIKEGQIEISPFFQRKLVWRDIHKSDFIKTILLGFPFPEIFIARGDIDIEEMTSVSAIVDGQQRMNAITEFTQNRLNVEGRLFTDLSTIEKEEFLKYEIAVIDLELDKRDPQVKEIFKRLNRTFYSLSQIEKISTEYASSYMMLVAKMLCGELVTISEDDERELSIYNVNPKLSELDPNISPDFSFWANDLELVSFWESYLNDIFSAFEVSRQVHLMFTLNVISTFLGDIFNRNELVLPLLEENKDDLDKKRLIVQTLESQAELILKLNLENHKFWFSKSNSFSLITALFDYNLETIDIPQLKSSLDRFAQFPDPTYALYAKEGVNNKKERLYRKDKIKNLIDLSQGIS